jgi:hypothetical protein
VVVSIIILSVQCADDYPSTVAKTKVYRRECDKMVS